MSGQRALVLIYDIRGFTAASKRVSTHDLGAFATGAHRAILDLFAAHPPTFVKHLGDGHLLLWETSNPPDPGLLADVVAGATKARTAFAGYIAGREAAGEHLPGTSASASRSARSRAPTTTTASRSTSRPDCRTSRARRASRSTGTCSRRWRRTTRGCAPPSPARRCD